MAQHDCANDKLDRGGCISSADRNLLRDRRLEGPRFCWQQDTGRARCGANDCLGSGVMESTRDMIKGEILGAPREAADTHGERVKRRFRGREWRLLCIHKA